MSGVAALRTGNEFAAHYSSSPAVATRRPRKDDGGGEWLRLEVGYGAQVSVVVA